MTLVEDIDLEIEQGEFVAVMGPSGSGKSSLLYLLGLLDMPTSGKIWLNGADTAGLSEDELRQHPPAASSASFSSSIFCSPSFPRSTMCFCRSASSGCFPKTKRVARGLELLGSLGLGDQAQKLPGQMSGGQRQRVAVARALANDPLIIFADEPTGALDTKSSENLRTIFQDLSRHQNRTVVVVTHDPSFAKAADRVLFLVDGKLQPPERAAELFALSIR